jgi:TonB family protein
MTEPTQTPGPLGPALAAPPVEGDSDPLAQTLALLQPWINYVPQRQRRLGWFVGIALLVHLLVGAVIHIDSTRAQIRHDPRRPVTIENTRLLAPSESSAERFWNRLSDPRLFLFPTSTPATDVARPDLGSLDAALATGPGPQPVPAPDFNFLPGATGTVAQRAGEALKPDRAAFTYATAPVHPPAATTWGWDAALAARHPANLAALPSPVSDTDLDPTRLRVAIDPEGTVDHVFIDQSCGQPELDQLAVLAAGKARLAADPAQQGDLWGDLAVYWHYTPTPREIVVPTPPTTQ